MGRQFSWVLLIDSLGDYSFRVKINIEKALLLDVSELQLQLKILSMCVAVVCTRKKYFKINKNQ